MDNYRVSRSGNSSGNSFGFGSSSISGGRYGSGSVGQSSLPSGAAPFGSLGMGRGFLSAKDFERVPMEEDVQDQPQYHNDEDDYYYSNSINDNDNPSEFRNNASTFSSLSRPLPSSSSPGLNPFYNVGRTNTGGMSRGHGMGQGGGGNNFGRGFRGGNRQPGPGVSGLRNAPRKYPPTALLPLPNQHEIEQRSMGTSLDSHNPNVFDQYGQHCKLNNQGQGYSNQDAIRQRNTMNSMSQCRNEGYVDRRASFSYENNSQQLDNTPTPINRQVGVLRDRSDGGSRGGRRGNWNRSGNNRFATKQYVSGGRGNGNNFRPVDKLQPSPTPASPAQPVLPTPSIVPAEDKEKTVSSNVGVHLDISPPIVKLMSNRSLGDKIFIMIPKYAKTVFDVKVHVALLLGIDHFLLNLFVNGFCIPNDEDVGAFACLSTNSLVQVVKSGYKPPCDLSKFNKIPESLTSNSAGPETSRHKKKKRKSQDQGHDQHTYEQVEVDALDLQYERKRKQTPESSPLEPPSRRGRFSDTTNTASTSPSKGPVIEIVLSDDEEEEKEEFNGSSSSSGKLVIEDITDVMEGIEESIPPSSNAKHNTSLNVSSGREQETNGDHNKTQGTFQNKQSLNRSSRKVVNSVEFLDENWLNADGEPIARPIRKSNNTCEIVDLSSPEHEQNNDNEDNESSTSTNDDNSNEPFFSITAIQSIPVGVFENKNMDDVVELSNINVTPSKEASKIVDQGDPSPTSRKVQVLSPIIKTTAPLLNPFNNDVGGKSPSSTAKRSDPVLVDISSEVMENVGGSNDKNDSCGDQNLTLIEKPCINNSKEDSGDVCIIEKNGESQFKLDPKKDPLPSETKMTPNSQTTLEDVNSIKCGSILIFQILETVPEIEKENENESDSAQNQKLSDVKYCKVIGRCGEKLTLEPYDHGIMENEDNDKTDATRRKFIFVDFKDMVNLREFIKD